MSIYVLGVSRDSDARSLESQIPYRASVSSSGVPACRDQPPDIGCPDWVFSGSLAAAVAHATHSLLSPDTHARTLAAIHQRFCILPMRYGTVLDGEEAVRTMLQARGSDFMGSLQQLEGSCELGVRIVLAHPTVPDPKSHHVTGSATDYLSWRRARYEREDALGERADQVTRMLFEATDGLYRQWRKLPSSSPDLLRLSFLVERACTTAFRNRVRIMDLATSEDKCAVLGPWPPFSFV